MLLQVIRFLALALLHFSVCVLAGTLGWHLQSVIVPAASVLIMAFATKRMNYSPALCLALTVPFFLVYVSAVFIVKAGYATYPVWISGMLVSLLSFFLLKYRVRPWAGVLWPGLIILANGLLVWPNTFAYSGILKDAGKYRLYSVKLTNGKDQIVPVNSLKGKVVLADIWHSACYNCIQRFPELQQLYNDYRGDTMVRIFSLNVPLKRDNGIKPVKHTDRYSFEQLYFASAQEADRLYVDAVPLILIIGKDGQCRYAGDLNTGWNIFAGNARRIINQLKNE